MSVRFTNLMEFIKDSNKSAKITIRTLIYLMTLVQTYDSFSE